jgi:hypothetical protein
MKDAAPRCGRLWTLCRRWSKLVAAREGGERAPVSVARPWGGRAGVKAVNRLARHHRRRGTRGMPGDQTPVTVCISQPFRRA